MNGRKKLLCVFLLAFFLFCYTSTNAFAVDTPGAAKDPGTTQGDTGKTNETGGQAGAGEAGGQTAGQTGTGEQTGQTGQTGGKPTDTKPTPPPSTSTVTPSSQTPSSKTPPPASSKPRRRRHVVSSAVSSMPESIPDFTSSEESSSGVISLPDAGVVSENDPFASASNGTPSKLMNRAGILAWVCIGLGILVVLIVILSNRRPPRGPGRSRYHRPKRSGKRLLNDKYYRGLKRY